MQHWKGRYAIKRVKRRDLTVITHARDAAAGVGQAAAHCALSEVVVIDMQSTDDTVAVARAAGARVLSTPYSTGGQPSRTRYLEEAETDWIFVLDATST